MGSQLRADLIYVSTSTEFGTYDTIGNVFTGIGTASSGGWGLAISGGVLYMNDSAGNSTLYQGGAGGWDSNFGPDGDIYTSSNGKLYRVNPRTGASAQVGSFGAGLEIGSLIAADGLLYGFAGTRMYDISLTTGHASYIRDLPGNHGVYYAEVQVPAATPEPAAFGFAASGIAGITYFRSRRAARAARAARLAFPQRTLRDAAKP